MKSAKLGWRKWESTNKTETERILSPESIRNDIRNLTPFTTFSKLFRNPFNLDQFVSCIRNACQVLSVSIFQVEL